MVETPPRAPPPGFFGDEDEEAPPPATSSALALWAESGKRSSSKFPIAGKSVSNKHFTPSVFRVVRDEVEAMCESGDWEKAGARHLVALCELLHREVYGIDPVETTSEDRKRASFLAGRALKDHFEGDPGRAVEFVRWAWQREQERLKWLRENGREGSCRRIGPGLIFRGMVGDWRAMRVRKGLAP